MATFEVNTLVDEADYGAEINIGMAFFPIFVPIGPDTSLREAIALANATPEEDTITFAAGLNGTIKLTTGTEIAITSDLRIEGENRITVSGDADQNDTLITGAGFSGEVTNAAAAYEAQLAGNTRIFNISDGGDVVIDGLTLTGGRANGADGSGGAIRITDDSGAADSASVTINNSTLAGNSVGAGRAGAAIFGENADITITNSDFSENRAGIGANFAGSEGGAVSTKNGNLAISNSTFVGNSVVGELSNGGAIYSDGSTIHIANSTITGNQSGGSGGGIYSPFNNGFEIANSIIVGNNATGIGDEIYFLSDAPTFTGQNIVGANTAAFDTSGGGGNVINADPETVFAITTSNGDQTSGVATDNGGPVRTIVLNDDVANPALDASTATGTDARGVERGFDQTFIDNGGLSDLGAFELAEQASGGETPSLVVNTTDDSFDPTDNQTSLREAIAFANDQAGAATITFAPSGQGLIRLTRGEIDITDALTI